MSQSSTDFRRWSEDLREAFGVVPEGPGGVGGEAGMKNAGSAMMTDCKAGLYISIAVTTTLSTSR